MIRRSIGPIWVSTLALLLSAPAWAAGVGRVSELSGQDAHRKAADGATESLVKGTELQVNDVITVGPGTRIKIALNDESVIALDENSELTIDEATFGQESKSFSARLGFGKFWAKVKKFVAGSDSKFEVKTDRAVAGVRGTIFRVDANTIAQSARPEKKQKQYVWVREGKVGVEAQVKKAAPSAGVNQVKSKGPRHQVAGPQQISKDAWEKKFAELQKGMAVEIGEELFTVRARPEPKDAFSKFVGP